MTDNFRIPEHTPQDLILIHGLIAVPVPGNQNLELPKPTDDNIDSSDSGDDSEDEIEADLVVPLGENDKLTISAKPNLSVPSESDSSSDSDSDSDPDSESNNDNKGANSKDQDQIVDDEDEPGPVATTQSYFQTKNEIIEADIAIPDIEEVGPEEELEKVGEVMSIIDNMVIIKGVASEIANRGSPKALDSDTLLVFEDRKVVGYVCETFGPTSRPFYQVKFGQRYPLDPEKVRVSRQVFHVPQRSNFVFLSQIRCLKGSDASNVHDEEPADDELEFSDDEQEAAHKSLKRKRGGESRANSVVSSRHTAHDHDLRDSCFLGATPYDEHGPYDMDFSAGSSRPPPIPYDDPYSDAYNVGISNCEANSDESSANVEQGSDSLPFIRGTGRGRGRGRGRGEGKERRQSAGRGQARGRGRGDRGRGGRGDRGQSHRQSHDETDAGWTEQPTISMPAYNPHIARPLSPTSLAIARATGQYADGTNFDKPSIADSVATPSFQQFIQQSYQQSQYQPQYVQPHINPRFASAFGINIDFMQAQAHPYNPQHATQELQVEYGQGSEAADQHWTDEWTVHAAKETGENNGGEIWR